MEPTISERICRQLSAKFYKYNTNRISITVSSSTKQWDLEFEGTSLQYACGDVKQIEEKAGPIRYGKLDIRVYDKWLYLETDSYKYLDSNPEK